MAGDFECRECGVRIYSPEWGGGEAPFCKNDEHDDSVRVTHAD